MGQGTNFVNREQFLTKLIDEIYTAPTHPERWGTVVKQIVETMGAASGQLVSPSKHAMSELWAPHGFGGEEMAPYATYYHQRDVWTQGATVAGLPTCTALTGEQLVDSRVFMKSEFYNDFLRHCDIGRLLTCVIETGDGDSVPKTSLSVYRPADSQPFDQDAIALFGLIAPHVRRALNLHRHIAGLEHENATNTAVLEQLSVGVLLIDETHRVSYRNPAAATILRENDGLAIHDSELVASNSETNSQLGALLADAVRTFVATGRSRISPMLVSRESGRPPYRISVVPLPAIGAFPVGKHRTAAIVFIANSSPWPDVGVPILAEIYGLTSAEARLVRKLASGHSPKQIANSLGLSVNTVRTQLSAVFSKTGTHRQPQLIRLIVSLAELQLGR